MVYYYLNDKDEIKSTGSLYIARKNTINHLFAHPSFQYGYIATSPKTFIMIKRGFVINRRDHSADYSLYDAVVGDHSSKMDKSIIELIYDDGTSFFTVKKGKYDPRSKGWHKHYLSMDGKIGRECFDYLNV